MKGDEEKVQTGATFVNMTRGTVIKLSMETISTLWMNDKLPSGDSRCIDQPPTEHMIKDAISGLRNQFGTDIHFAKDSGKWYVFISFLPFLFLSGLFVAHASMPQRGGQEGLRPKKRRIVF